MQAQIDDLVGQVAGFLEVDHGVLARPALNGGSLGLAHHWARPGCAPLEPLDPTVHLPWISGRLDSGIPVYLAKPDDLPAEAASDQAFLQQSGIRSIASLPLFVAGTLAGRLLFTTIPGNRCWPSLRIDQLERTSEIVASALARVEAHRELRRAIEFDQVVAGLAASLIRVPADAIDAQIETTLRTVGEFLGADRGAVTQLDQ